MVELFKAVFIQAQGEHEIQDFDELLRALDLILVSPPGFLDWGGDPVPVPIALIFEPLNNTAAAFDLFRKHEFNVAFQKLLNSRGDYLQTPASSKTLHKGAGSWFSTQGLDILETEGRGKFEDTYIRPDPNQRGRGFTALTGLLDL
ncbi:Phophatidylserine decarboxylase-domain-containing protein [Mycena polygramma]|nr:Phophatidylserine decarboxylase-domain-containing protein [Mycena polygramma]